MNYWVEIEAGCNFKQGGQLIKVTLDRSMHGWFLKEQGDQNTGSRQKREVEEFKEVMRGKTIQGLTGQSKGFWLLRLNEF